MNTIKNKGVNDEQMDDRESKNTRWNKMINEAGKIANVFVQWQSMTLILLGMFIQFFFTPNKTLRVAVLILISSIFVAWSIVPALVDIINIFISAKHKILIDSNIYRALLGSSTLISVELLALIIKFAPKAVENRMTNYLGVKKNDNRDE